MGMCFCLLYLIKIFKMAAEQYKGVLYYLFALDTEVVNIKDKPEVQTNRKYGQTGSTDKPEVLR